jgi:hypothetical protein
MAQGILNIKYNDYDPEPSYVKLYLTPITAANFDNQVLAASAIYDAIAGANGICLGKRITSTLGNVYEILGSKIPADTELAQREVKWKVNYTSAGGTKSGYFTLPCADLTLLDPNNRGYADKSNADVAAFISAVEAAVVDEDGDAITVVDIKFVGRNT